jgi:hypothetical protein
MRWNTIKKNTTTVFPGRLRGPPAAQREKSKLRG